MKLAPDFFGLFAATAPLLDADPSLYCVSSWNDHGQKQFVTDSTRLLRSDFFPGLGWMLTREIWQDIRRAQAQTVLAVMHGALLALLELGPVWEGVAPAGKLRICLGLGEGGVGDLAVLIKAEAALQGEGKLAWPLESC